MDTPDPLFHRKTAARMANKSRETGDASGWFEPFYQWAAGHESQIPWADLEPHPLLLAWFGTRDLAAFSSIAVVGCGLGDDAEFLAPYANSIWGFDIAPTAIEWAKKRFPNSKIDYTVGDIYDLPNDRLGQFELVVEVYTLQAVPPELRLGAMIGMESLLAPGGEILIISRWRTEDLELGAVPWPLLLDEIIAFESLGLSLVDEYRAEPGQPGYWVFRKPI